MRMRKKQVKISIGIPSYNENKNLIRLLDKIKIQKLYEVAEIKEVIISDDSDDNTPELIKKYLEYEKSNLEIKYIHHHRRRGVAAAWNEIFRMARGDIIVLYDADIFLTEKTTYHLIKKMIKDKEIGIVGGNTIALLEKGMASETSYFISRWLNHVRTKYPESQFTIMGRVLALRRELASKIYIPTSIIAVDLYIEAVAYKEGYRVSYARNALIFFKPARTLYENMSQIIRAIIGHSQIKNIVDKYIPQKLGIKTQFKLFIETMLEEDIKYVYSTIVSYLIGIIYIPIVWKGAARHLWEIAITTK